MQVQRRLNISHLLVMLSLLLLIMQGCTVQYVADYDEVTDRSLMDLQRKFDTFFVQLEDQVGTPAASYDRHRAFYREAKVDISSLRLRVDALPMNTFSSKAVGLLEENLGLLKELHQTGIDNIEVVNIVREDFNRSIVNILRLELAKKRGEL